jgi:hypothetical protein
MGHVKPVVNDKAFQIIAAGESHTFDSFECAIQGDGS